jgi:rubrerythrin
VKTKPKSHVQVVEDEVIGGDDVFQMDELVDAYRVALFAEIENLDFYVIKNTYIDVDVDVDELNIILSISIHRKNNNE